MAASLDVRAPSRILRPNVSPWTAARLPILCRAQEQFQLCRTRRFSDQAPLEHRQMRKQQHLQVCVTVRARHVQAHCPRWTQRYGMQHTGMGPASTSRPGMRIRRADCMAVMSSVRPAVVMIGGPGTGETHRVRVFEIEATRHRLMRQYFLHGETGQRSDCGESLGQDRSDRTPVTQRRRMSTFPSLPTINLQIKPVRDNQVVRHHRLAGPQSSSRLSCLTDP